MNQHHVMNHFAGAEMKENRNVLVESARIARGKVKDLKSLNMGDYDALVFPGGFGVAKNLCDWAFKGPDCEVNPQVAQVVTQAIKLDKPIGAMCIAPVMLGKLLGDVSITIGADPNDARMVEKMGSKHVSTAHGQVVRDKKYKIFTAPCYMLDASIKDIAQDTEALVNEMVKVM